MFFDTGRAPTLRSCRTGTEDSGGGRAEFVSVSGKTRVKSASSWSACDSISMKHLCALRVLHTAALAASTSVSPFCHFQPLAALACKVLLPPNTVEKSTCPAVVLLLAGGSRRSLSSTPIYDVLAMTATNMIV